MVIYMKTTLTISDVTMREVKREAARRQQTMSEMVEAALRTIIEPVPREAKLPPLPEFESGGLRVNVANRDALYDVMGG
ncbi:MAG: ribbon-helix-helix protein, CopG family [Lentisphaerae bacterium]|nr:ribbon-helix-helix protein, CopG family [Lentisphaerota bacterium]